MARKARKDIAVNLDEALRQIVEAGRAIGM
jgi:hypothetical protein